MVDFFHHTMNQAKDWYMEAISFKLVIPKGIVKLRKHFLRVNIQTMLLMDQEEILTFILWTVAFILNNRLLSIKNNSNNSLELGHKKQEKQLKITSIEGTEEWICTNKKNWGLREYCLRVQVSKILDSIISLNLSKILKTNYQRKIEFTIL